MNWNPDRDFRFDLGYINAKDLDGDITKLPHYDLSHLGLWSKCMLKELGYIKDHELEEIDRYNKAFAGQPFVGWILVLLNKDTNAPIAKNILHNLEQPLKDITVKLKAACDTYIIGHGGDANKILQKEKQGRWLSGAILQGDIDEHDVISIKALHPKADYVGRVKWILKQLEPVKEPFKVDYSYWQNILKLVGG